MSYVLATPRGHLFNSIRADTSFTAAKAFAELIDNSLDAGATRIDVTLDHLKSLIVIEDNGRGCDDLSKLLVLGHTGSGDVDASIGRYGVGHPHACMLLSDREEVLTHCEGIARSATVAWSDIASGRLEIGWEETPPRASSQRGTRITLHGDRKDATNRRRYMALARQWARMYSPSIAKGVVVAVNGDPLKGVPSPALKSKKRVRNTERCAKRYVATVGLLANEQEASGAGWSSGFVLACHGRIIAERVWDGADDFSGGLFWAYVDLAESADFKWHLDTHKGGLGEEDLALLMGDLVPQVIDVLVLAQEKSRIHEFKVIEEEWSNDLADVFGGTSGYRIGRALREKGKGGTGTVEPKGTGKTHKKAKKINENKDGNVINIDGTREQSGHGWKIQFAHLSDKEKVGEPHVSAHGATMKLNLDHPWVASNKNNKETLIPLSIRMIWDGANEKNQKRLWLALFGHDEIMEFREPDPIARGSMWLGKALSIFHAKSQKPSTKEAA